MEATILSFSTDIPDVRTPYLDKPNAQSRAKGCPEWDRCRLMGRRPSDGAHKSLMIGGPGKIRTPDLLVRSQTLYPTELRARGSLIGGGCPPARRGLYSGFVATKTSAAHPAADSGKGPLMASVKPLVWMLT